MDTCKILQPIGESNNPDYYVIGHSVSETEVINNVLFDVSGSKSGSYLDSVLNSLNINSMNCRFNKLIRYYVEDTDSISEDELLDNSRYLIEDIERCNPKIIIALGSAVAKILLGDKFRRISNSRGRIYDIELNNNFYKLLITYSPNYITKVDSSGQDMSEYASLFYNDLFYCTRFVKGELVDISSKNLTYAKTYDEFKQYFDTYLKDAPMPSYDIESNAKDPRCADFRIVGFSLSPDGSTGIYVIRNTLEYSMSNEDWEKCVELTKDYLMSRTSLVHNIMYEKPATLNEWGINIVNFEDSLIKARLLLGGKTGAGLKDQCILNLGYPEWDADLGSYMNYFGVLWTNLSHTSSGNHRWDFDVLAERGFNGLVEEYVKRLSILDSLEEVRASGVELSKEQEKLSRDNWMSDKERASYRATQDLVALLHDYYNPDEIPDICELIGSELVNLISINYEGILPYSSIPMKIITKYGAMDAVATQDLDKFLSKRLTDESSDTVNLWNGYRVAKEHFIVASYLEMNGLYWDEKVATSNYEWLASTAKESLRNCIMSGFLDDQIVENSMFLLQDYVKENMMEYVREVLGDFEMQKLGIKIISTGKRISYKNIIWELPQSFRDKMRPWILETSKKRIMDDDYHPSYEDLKYIFNPASNKNTPILDKILVTNEIQIGYVIVKLREEIDSESFNINLIPNPDRLLYKTIIDIDKYNKSENDNKITSRQLFYKISAILEQITPSSKSTYSIINDAVHYHLEGTSEPVMLKLFDYYEAIGIDIEDESTYTPEFSFFYNFRMYKKCTKLISSYINGSKIGRGSVWVVNKEDIDNNKVEPIRTHRYDWNSPKKDDEEYLMQPTWMPLTAETLRWRSGIHCLHPDTEIRLTDGRNITVKELKKEFDSGKNNYVYSMNEVNKKLQVELIRDVYISHKTNDMIRVYLDNDEYFEVTPDHKMVLRDGTYIETRDLLVGDQLYPVTTRSDGNAEVIFDPFSSKEVYCQDLSDDFNKRYQVIRSTCSNNIDCDESFIFHRDSDFLNNNPDNLIRIRFSDYDSTMTDKQSYIELLSKLTMTDDQYNQKINSFRNMYYDDQYNNHSDTLDNGLSNCDNDNDKRNRILKFINNYSGITTDNFEDIAKKQLMKLDQDLVLHLFDSVDEAIRLSKLYSRRVVGIQRIHYEIPISVYSVAIYSGSPSFSLSCGVMSKNTLPMGRVVKGMYTSRYKGGVIAAPDYSQLEVRITAGLSKCKPLIEAYEKGEDVHLKTACGIFQKSPDQITGVERRFSKMGCVVGSTRIILPDGSSPTIEEIYNKGLSDDRILSCSDDGNAHTDRIVGCELTKYVNDTTVVHFDNGSYIECTVNHPFLTSMMKYVRADHLSPNTSIQSIYYKIEDELGRVANNDTSLNHKVIWIEYKHYQDPIPVYDLSVKDYHNYPILLERISDNEFTGVYVHNTFRILYGSTPEGFASQFLDGDVALARKIFDGFYDTYPEVKEWMNRRHEEVERTGKVSCENVGYYINIDVANDPEGLEGAFRKAGNYPIQSQGSMVAGYVLSSINNYFMSNNMFTKPISFIHDSLEFDIHPHELFQVAPVILRMMNDIPINEFGILTEADVVIGTSMGMENEIKEMKFSDDNSEGWLTLEGFDDDLDDMYNHWKYNTDYKLVEYEEIGDPEPVYTRKRELFQEKLALGPFLGKTRYLTKRKFHLIMK